MQELNQWARDTGQNPSTLRYYKPVVYIAGLDRRLYPTVNHRLLYYVSKKLQYTRTQLLSFDPSNPQLRRPPLYGYAPPNLLLGYKALIDVVRARPFDSTTVSQFTFHPIKRLGVLEQMEWSVLATGDIHTDVGEYGNLVDLDSWEQHADQIDVQNIRETRNRLLLNRLVNSERNLIGSGIPNDAAMLGTQLLNDVRIAAFNYAMLSAAARPVPTVEDFLDGEDNWIHRLIKNFSSTRWQEWIPPDTASPIDAISLGAQAMTLGNDTSQYSSLWELTGGAMRLRSGRLVGTPYNLRGPRRYPIYTAGRQIDARTRQRAARNYVRRRLGRRRAVVPQQPPPPPSPEQQQQQQEEEDQDDDDDDDAGLVPHPAMLRENSPAEFHMEIMRLLEEIARQASAAQPVLSDSAPFVSYPQSFYRALRDHIAESISFGQEANPSFIKAWLINYLIAEQLSQVLSIFSNKFGHNRHPKARFCQIVLVARNDQERELFKRIWSSTERPYDMFHSLFNRIVKDLVNTLALILSQPDVNQPNEETEAMLLESGLADVSGEIADVLEQVTSYEQIVNITVTVKLKCRGIVAYSRNRDVVNAFKRWIEPQVRSYLETRGPLRGRRRRGRSR